MNSSKHKSVRQNHAIITPKLSRKTKMALHNLGIGDDAPNIINTIIEIPRGSGHKIEFDHKQGVFVLDREQPNSLRYPVNYADIPGTLGGDGDPLDAVVICEDPLPMGVVVEARVVGLMSMIDDGDEDHKIVCVPAKDKNMQHIKDIEDVPQHWKDRTQHFFERYKDLKSNELVEINGWSNKEAAYKVIKAAQAAAS